MPRGIHSKIVFTLPYMVMSIPNMVLWVILFAKVKNHVFCRTVPKWWGCVDSVSVNPPFVWGPQRGPKWLLGRNVSVPLHPSFPGQEWTQVTQRLQCQCAITSFFFFPGQEWTQVIQRLQYQCAIISVFCGSRLGISVCKDTLSLCQYILFSSEWVKFDSEVIPSYERIVKWRI